jgi:hypothetical protein
MSYPSYKRCKYLLIILLHLTSSFISSSSFPSFRSPYLLFVARLTERCWKDSSSYAFSL